MDDRQPVLSIVTVVKNDLIGLQKTLESFRGLPDSEVEVLIVDGGSSDGSEKLAHVKNRKYIESRLDGGIYPAMWRGAEAATGEYLMFINAGERLIDYSLLDRALHEIGKTLWGYGPIIENSPRNTLVWTATGANPSILNVAFRRTFIPFPSTIFLRDFFMTLGGFSSQYSIAADFDIELRARIAAEPYVWNFPLVLFQSGGISYSKPIRAWWEEHLSRASNLNGFRFLKILSLVAFLRRVARYFIGRVIDFIDGKIVRDKNSWRDRKSLAIPSEIANFLHS